MLILFINSVVVKLLKFFFMLFNIFFALNFFFIFFNIFKSSFHSRKLLSINNIEQTFGHVLHHFGFSNSSSDDHWRRIDFDDRQIKVFINNNIDTEHFKHIRTFVELIFNEFGRRYKRLFDFWNQDIIEPVGIICLFGIEQVLSIVF